MQVGYVSEVTCKYTHEGGNITQDKLFYSESVSCVMQRHFDRNKHDIPGWLNGAIKTSLRREYRGLSFLNAKLKKRSDAVKYIAKSLKYPDLATLYYFCQTLEVLYCRIFIIVFKHEWRRRGRTHHMVSDKVRGNNSVKERNMRILFVCDKLITFILNDISELSRLGHKVSILSTHRDRSIYEKIVFRI